MSQSSAQRWPLASRCPWDLSPSASETLSFIRNEIVEGRSFPSMEILAAHMGWKSVAGSRDILNTLASKGYIRMVSRVSSGRGFRYTWEIV